MTTLGTPASAISAVLLAFAAGAAHAASVGTVITPPSAHAGRHRAHTNFAIFVPEGGHAFNQAPSGPYETPASLACVYGLTTPVAGCNPETLHTVATAGSQVVAIVDAYDDPTAASDLATFSRQFGLPPINADNFEVVYETGSAPPQDPTGSWELEESLDIEMAHALAPGAKIVLVEAQSNSTWDLVIAEGVAEGIVRAAGGGEISNSWASGEDANETGWQSGFSWPGSVVFAAAGDQPGPVFPAVLPNVVAVGGTTILRDGQGNYRGQTSWSATGGGLSRYVARPHYQQSVENVVGTRRGTPDVAFDADPASGVWIYDTTPYNGSVPQWTVVGGTSMASPALAAIVNDAGSFLPNTRAELQAIYAGRNGGGWTDITAGECPNAGGASLVGYDLCTGVGVPAGVKGK